MKKTLLLVFIHGFKGGDDTFVKFPSQLCALIKHALPNIDVVAHTYPKFDTRGELKDCVGRFREWLQDKVIDIEVANATPSPTVDPSVHVILVGHSMGGIVGAETLLLLASEQPIPSMTSSQSHEETAAATPLFMFPYIQGLLAFDTPFLGISPGVVSHGAEEHYKTATTAYSTFTEVAGLFGYGGNKDGNSTSAASTPLALPPTTSSGDAAATPSWQRWGRMAMFAGAAGAVAAGGAAALYTQRDRFTEGWGWVTSHLEFVGCLARPGDMRKRVAALADLQRDRGISSTNIFTCLGKAAAAAAASSGSSTTTSSLILRIPRAQSRTFCHLPEDFDEKDTMLRGTQESPGLRWRNSTNDKAVDEITAHVTMFTPKDNPSYYSLVHEAAETLVGWVDQGWYASATGRPTKQGQGGQTNGKREGDDDGDGSRDPSNNEFMEEDDVVVVD